MAALPGAEPFPLTPAAAGLRFADATVDASRLRLVCVAEDHAGGGEPRNRRDIYMYIYIYIYIYILSMGLHPS